MNLTQKLMQVRKEIETHKFSKGSYAKKANGKTECSPLDPKVKCLCFLGALAKVWEIDTTKDSEEERLATEEEMLEVGRLFNEVTNNQFKDWKGEAEIHLFNDEPTTTKKDVLEILNAMITLSKFSQE